MWAIDSGWWGLQLEIILLENPWVFEDRCASAGGGGGVVGESKYRRANNSLSFAPDTSRAS